MAIKIFAEILKYPYVIIYDNANGNKLHKTSCSYVTKENYDLKVIINEEKNGYYKPLETCEDIDMNFINPCKVCRPTQ
ncbi:hypothetical protein ACT8ZR_01560 [Neobacillus sp. M.A.Huq-85]